jgi:hypothetical protein
LLNLLPKELAKQFSKEEVYIRGIAPREPLSVDFTTAFTTIPIANKQPIDKIRWHRQDYEQTLRLLKKVDDFEYELENEPLDSSSVQVRLIHDSFDAAGRAIDNVVDDYTIPYFEYRVDAGRPVVVLDVIAIRSELRKRRVKDQTKVQIRIEYQIP